MSKLITNTVRHTAGSADNITLDNSQNVTVEGNLTVDGTTTLTGAVTLPDGTTPDTLSFRNLIINGAMNVAQRGTSSTSSGYQTVDRFTTALTGVDENPTQAQHALTSSDTGPWEKGFRFSYHLTNGNQTSGAGGADYVFLYQNIEAQNIASSGWDYTSASSYITLSFWVRSSVAQNFFGYIRSRDGTEQSRSFQTGSLSANTWTKITKAIPGNSNIQIDNNSAVGLGVYLAPFFGADYTDDSKTVDTWSAYVSGERTPDTPSTWYTTNDATLEITGVQLEVGDTATEFEHRSYGDELARCQRYYRLQSKSRASGKLGGSQNYVSMVSFPLSPQMRNTPTVLMYGSASYNGNVSTIDTVNVTLDHIGIMANISDGNYYYYNNGWTADAEL